MAELELREVSKAFGNVKALDSLTLHVKDKEFVVLLGPSGCGKTTALRCIAGLEHPDKGEIYIGGTLVNDLPPKDRDVAVVFQSYALYPHKTVFGNLAFPLQVRRYRKESIIDKVREVARLLEMEHLLDRKPKQLSGGEQQRVALGRALVRQPKIFLMDEPLSNLDAKLRLHTRAELKRLHKKLGITTIYVTHDQAEAMTMADRIAVLNRGILQQVGSPEEIYSNPTDTFVAGFVGSPSMNLLEATRIVVDDEIYAVFPGLKYHLPQQIQEVIRDSSTPDSKLVIGIRPEDVKISKERSSSNAVTMEVYVLEPLGSEVIADLKLGDAIIKAKAPPDFKANIGDVVYVTFTPTKIRVFDGVGGKAIT